MALVEVARFHTLSEAHVAASLLRSAGVQASIADIHYGSVFWMEQKALGGFRLSVPQEDLVDTLEILRHPPDLEPLGEDDEIPPSITDNDRIAATALLVTAGAAAGWLAAGKGRFGYTASFVLAFMLVALSMSFVVAGWPWIRAVLGF